MGYLSVLNSNVGKKDQKNSEYRQFSRSLSVAVKTFGFSRLQEIFTETFIWVGLTKTAIFANDSF